MRTRLWPTGLIGRVGLVLFTAILLELVGSTILFEQAELFSNDITRVRRISEELDAGSRVLNATDAARRHTVAKTLSDVGTTFEWHPDAPGGTPSTQPDGETIRDLRSKLIKHQPALAHRHLILHADPRTTSGALFGSFDLDDGSTVNFQIKDVGPTTQSIPAQLSSILLLTGCVLLAALLVVRTLAAPLQMLVRATDAIGHGPPIHIDDRGPREIRRVAQAFNAMQDRIGRLINDRTEALAAVSHDLRTPIARLRLRAGFLASEEDRKAFDNDLSEMEAMLEGLMAYLGGESDPEKPRRTDIAAMLTTLVGAAEDAGHRAHYDGPDHAPLTLRPLAIKRAFSNVINNAIAYGNTASVAVVEHADLYEVRVEDEGPGIAEPELEKVFEPFYGVDASRSLARSGMGLGLAIVRQAIWREGGTITLQNRPEGGLRVTMTLPR